MLVSTREVDDMFSLVVGFRVDHPAARPDLVGGASAGEVAQIKVLGVSVES